VKNRIQFAYRFLAVVMAATTAVACSTGGAQTPSSAAVGGPDQPKTLFITILEGEGALNDIRARTAREPIVEVDDENHKPVAGALVLFSLDNGGGSPYATFAGSPTYSVETDTAGRATARGFQITQRKGKYNIRVHATKSQAQAEAVIAESNIAMMVSSEGSSRPAAAVSHKSLKWVLGSVAVGGVIAGIVIATRQSSTTTISPGTGTVGAPAAVGGIHFQFHPRTH
jgi:hypothetical protein